MNASIETANPVWDEQRDGMFFRIVQAVFPAEFVYGAGVLLASYDDEGEGFSTETVLTADGFRECEQPTHHRRRTGEDEVGAISELLR